MALISAADAEEAGRARTEQAGARRSRAGNRPRTDHAEAQARCRMAFTRGAICRAWVPGVNGRAKPSLGREHGASLIVDAADGLAFLACALAIERATGKARGAGRCGWLR